MDIERLQGIYETYSDDLEKQRLSEMRHDTLFLIEHGIAKQLVTSHNTFKDQKEPTVSMDTVHFHIRKLLWEYENPCPPPTTVLMAYIGSEGKFIGEHYQIHYDNFLGSPVHGNFLNDWQIALLTTVAQARQPVETMDFDLEILNKRLNRISEGNK